MRKYSRWLLVLSVLVVSMTVLPAMAQDPPPVDFVNDIDAPIDGGVGILLAAGVAYGIKKNRDNKKKRTTHLL